jgi:hypothetical protein
VNHTFLQRFTFVIAVMAVMPAHAAYTEEWLGARPTRQAAEASAHPAAPRKATAHKTAQPADAADPIADLITKRVHPPKSGAPAKPAGGKRG